MQCYLLSQIIKSDFRPTQFEPAAFSSADTYKLSYASNNKPTHYGLTVFKSLNRLLPAIWTPGTVRFADLDNSNQNQSNIVWYLDGMDQISLKHLLPTVSSYAIHELPLDKAKSHQLYIQKPSHPYIGAGKFISVSDNLAELIASRPVGYELAGKIYPIDHWVVQPLIEPLLWDGRKFDSRFYAVVYAHREKIWSKTFPYGIGRICVNVYDPLRDPSSAITNISIQDKLPGFDLMDNVPLIKDDLGLVEKMLTEMLSRVKLTTDGDKLSVMILGFDIMFSPDGTPKLIEVNHEPYLEVEPKGAEGFCSQEVIEEVFGKTIPNWIYSKQQSRPLDRPPPVGKGRYSKRW